MAAPLTVIPTQLIRQAVGLTLLVIASGAFAQTRNLHAAHEVVLPKFQFDSMHSDLPARKVLVSSHRTVWVLGNESLWEWRLSARRLRKIALLKSDDGAGRRDRLLQLGTDGVSIFAGSRYALFEWQPKRRKLFRYDLPGKNRGGATLGFAGFADDFWWIHQEGLFRVDRYGKKLLPKFKRTTLGQDSAFYFDTKSKNLWYVRERELLHVRLDDKQETHKPRVIFKASRPLLGVKALGQRLLTHTDSSVLQLARGGKRLQSVPVVGERKLIQTHISERDHLYLFDDGLVDRFDLKAKTSSQYQLPPDGPYRDMHYAQGVMATIVGAEPRVFRLASEVLRND